MESPPAPGARRDELTAADAAEASPRTSQSTEMESCPVPGTRLVQLTSADAGEVTVLQRCCWVTEAIVNDSLKIPPLHESVADVQGWLGAWRVVGLRRDGRLIAMVRTVAEGDEMTIGRLAIAPDLRRVGLGRWLLRVAESHADPDCRRIVMMAGARSASNIALYASEGYVLVGEEPETPETAAAVWLAKDLA